MAIMPTRSRITRTVPMLMSFLSDRDDVCQSMIRARYVGRVKALDGSRGGAPDATVALVSPCRETQRVQLEGGRGGDREE
jgi:hypothetical protein